MRRTLLTLATLTLFYRMATSVVNLYGSSYRSFPTPSGRDSIYERHLLTVKGQFASDTFYFPETRVFFKARSMAFLITAILSI